LLFLVVVGFNAILASMQIRPVQSLWFFSGPSNSVSPSKTDWISESPQSTLNFCSSTIPRHRRVHRDFESIIFYSWAVRFLQLGPRLLASSALFFFFFLRNLIELRPISKRESLMWRGFHGNRTFILPEPAVFFWMRIGETSPIKWEKYPGYVIWNYSLSQRWPNRAILSLGFGFDFARRKTASRSLFENRRAVLLLYFTEIPLH
jgi:hypothetical protein